MLACTASFDPDDGVQVTDIWVDETKVPASVWSTGQFDALSYLKRNELGLIAPGRHTFFILPNNGYVSSSVAMKVIEKI